MDLSIYDLSYDFIQQNGHYLVFDEKRNQPILKNDLVPLQMKMIESNRIPYLLPIHTEEMDFRVKLHYDITSKRMLSLFLRDQTMSMKDYYGLFLKIIAALEDSQLYLLDQERYLLKEEFIFIGKTIQDVHLTYLPFQQVPDKAPFEKDLKALLINIGGEIQGLEGEGFQAILNYTKDPGFHLKGLKDLLLELQSHSHKADQPASAEKFKAQEPFSMPPDDSETEKPLLFEQAIGREKQETPVPARDIQQPVSPQSNKELPPLTQREKILMMGFSLVTLALIWKFYGLHPSRLFMDVCAVLSLLVVAADFVFWKIWRPGHPKEAIEEVAAVSPVSPGTSFRFEPSDAMAAPQPSEMDSWKKAVSAQSPSRKNTSGYYDQLHQNTTLLSHSDDTVMLNVAEDVDHQTPESPYLLREDEGKSEKVHISEIPFVIGRNPSTVQYIEDSVGVSRNHLEIIQEEGVYSAKDLGSRNGSQINGQQMVPYKWYALKNEDKLVLGGVPFIFRSGLSK